MLTTGAAATAASDGRIVDTNGLRREPSCHRDLRSSRELEELSPV